MVARYIRGAVARAMSDAELEPYLAPWRGPVGQPAFYRQIAQMDQRFTDAIEPLLGHVRCPVDILWGEADGWIPVGQASKLAAAMPGARLRIVPGAGHLMQEDAPEAIVAAIAEMR